MRAERVQPHLLHALDLINIDAELLRRGFERHLVPVATRSI